MFPSGITLKAWNIGGNLGQRKRSSSLTVQYHFLKLFHLSIFTITPVLFRTSYKYVHFWDTSLSDSFSQLPSISLVLKKKAINVIKIFYYLCDGPENRAFFLPSPSFYVASYYTWDSMQVNFNCITIIKSKSRKYFTRKTRQPATVTKQCVSW